MASAGTRFLQIEPTTRCNFTCGFCVGRHMAQRDLSLELFERALAAFPSLEHVELQGEGEPLMHPRFFAMAEALRARGVAVSVITNGSFLSDENNRRLVALSLSAIRVSLESAAPDEFRRIRGGKLEKVVRGLRHLVAVRDEHRRAHPGAPVPAIGFAVTLLKSTIDDFDRVLELYRELGLDDGITLQPLQKMDAYASIYPEEIRGETIDAETFAAFVRTLQPGSPRALPPKSGRDFYSSMRAADAARPGPSCLWLENGGAMMNMDGQVTACCMIKDESFALGRLGDAAPPEAIEARVARGRDGMRAELEAGSCPAACVGCPVIERIESVRPLAYPAGRRLPIVDSR